MEYFVVRKNTLYVFLNCVYFTLHHSYIAMENDEYVFFSKEIPRFNCEKQKMAHSDLLHGVLSKNTGDIVTNKNFLKKLKKI